MEILERGQQRGQEMIDHQVRRQNEKPQNKGRKRTSKVWDDFTKSTGEDGSEWAVCNRCGKKFDGSSKKGTTHLKNHSDRCRRKRNNGDGDADKSIRAGHLTAPMNVVIKEKSVIDLIKHSFSGDWDSAELNSRKVDILQLYIEEKEKLQRFLTNLTSRFSLRIVSFGECLVLMVYYIDDRWEMNRKIIKFSSPQNYLDDFHVIQILKNVLLDWKIHRNLCSIITQNCIKNFRELNRWVGERVSLPFVGLQFDIFRLVTEFKCFVVNTLRTIGISCRIEECLRYVCKLNMFKTAIDKAKSMGKKVTSEAVPEQIVLFKEFEIAVGLKEAFCELEQMDPDFKLKNLTEEQWDEATVMCEHLRQLDDIAHKSKYTTTNMYFSVLCDLYAELLWWEKSKYFDVCLEAAVELKVFVDLYWSRCNQILTIATVLDPRFKMDIVEKWYKKIYDSEVDVQLKNIRSYLTKVFNQYAKGSESGDATSSTSYKMLDAMGRPCPSSQEDIVDASLKSQLSRYLSEPTLPRVEEFNILAWWRAYSPIFPTLARIARDFLSIPTFVITSSELESLYHFKYEMTGLGDDIREALLCLKDWM